MAAQLQEIPLEKLLNLALGHPGQGVVDFRLLKEFLMQFLVATKTNDFAVAKKFAGHGGEIVAELRPKVKDGVEDIDREAVGTMLILDSQSSDQEDYNNLGVLTKQIKRLSFYLGNFLSTYWQNMRRLVGDVRARCNTNGTRSFS